MNENEIFDKLRDIFTEVFDEMERREKMSKTLEEMKSDVISQGRYKWKDSSIELSGEDIERIKNAQTKAKVQTIIGDLMLKEMMKK